MDENLVGYLLDSLDEKTRCEVEAHLQANPAARQRLVRLRQALQPLALDADAPTPPSDLVVRTLGRVAEHICSDAGRAAERDLPHSPALRFESPGPVRAWWRRADLLVAACLLVTALGAFLPALLRTRDVAVVACKNNLREFFVALQTYRDNRGQFPNVEDEGSRNVAGMVVPILVDAGTLPASASIRCPGVGTHQGCDVTLAALRSMEPDQFRQHSPQLSQSYAYSLGYRDEAGIYYAPGANSAACGGNLVPLMGDRPLSADGDANSPNHGGGGQNVLFTDGHVEFRTTRTVADDDIFLNRDNHVAAGLGARDAVLGSSASRP